MRTGTFVAFLKHSLLFHEHLLLSDSLVVNTPNLRRAMQADPDLREYLTKGCLVIARPFFVRHISSRSINDTSVQVELRGRCGSAKLHRVRALLPHAATRRQIGGLFE
jgi:hypothetical protein